MGPGDEGVDPQAGESASLHSVVSQHSRRVARGKDPDSGGGSCPQSKLQSVRESRSTAQRGDTFHQDFLAALSGDLDALERFAAEARRKLLRSLRGPLRGGWAEHWLEDVVQDAMVDVCAHLSRCQARSDRELSGWVRAIGQRELANLFRAEAFRRVTIPLSEDQGAPASAERSPSGPLGRLIRRRLRHIGDDAQELLWLRLGAGATWVEVAMELGTTPSGAKRRYQRLVARLGRARPPPTPRRSEARQGPSGDPASTPLIGPRSDTAPGAEQEEKGAHQAPLLLKNQERRVCDRTTSLVFLLPPEGLNDDHPQANRDRGNCSCCSNYRRLWGRLWPDTGGVLYLGEYSGHGWAK